MDVCPSPSTPSDFPLSPQPQIYQSMLPLQHQALDYLSALLQTSQCTVAGFGRRVALWLLSQLPLASNQQLREKDWSSVVVVAWGFPVQIHKLPDLSCA